MLLRPKKVMTQFEYQCNCGCKWEYSHDEVQKVGSAICYGCGEHMIFEKFTLRVNIEFLNKEQSIDEKIGGQVTKIETNKDAVDALVALGYKKKFAEENVNIIMRDFAGLSTEEIIIRACQEEKK